MKKFTLIAVLFIFTAALFTGCSDAVTNAIDNSTSSSAASEDHEYSVQIEGSEIKTLTVKQVADLWKIDSQKLLNAVVAEFKLKNNYTVDTIIEDMRAEYKFSPAMVKEIAERIKKEASL